MYLDSGIHVGDNSVEVVVSLPPFTEPGTLCSITLGIAGTKLVALVLPLANVPHPDAPSKKTLLSVTFLWCCSGICW